jgi:eukaryotic-like serine/threonine-protein kinase
VKVLDFGLAKLTQPLNGERANSSSAALSTEEGRIMGTAAYMSPEQAEGKAVDARSDIFSFGSVLYEMITGRRAFRGDSSAATISEILKSEPAQLNAGIPHDLAMIITRCLRKDPARRFQHLDDLKLALEDLKEASDPGKLGIEVSPDFSARRWRRVFVPVLAVLALTAAGAIYYSQRFSKKEAPLKVVPLTTYPGLQSAPSFSPDGSQIAFSWNGEKQDNFDIYVQLVIGGQPLRLTTDPQPEISPVWSPDGSQIAFVRNGFLYLVSPLGGPERKLSTAVTHFEPLPRPVLAWRPDGRALAVVDRESDDSPRTIYLYFLATGERQRLTFQPAESYSNDWECAFSPDGKSMAFTRGSWFQNEIYILSLVNGTPNGEPWRLTEDKSRVAGLAWSPDNREIIYSSERGGRRSLWRIPVSSGAAPTRVPGTEDAVYPAISRSPSPRLAYQRSVHERNIWHMEISPSEKTANPPIRIIASRQIQRDPQFSPDGKKIAFTSERSGNPEIWVSDSGGSNPVQLTTFAGTRTAGAPRWSPDGRRIAFDSGIGPSFAIFVISADGGAPRQLTTDPGYCVRPSWSQDGHWIYFGSEMFRTQICKVPSEGGKPVQVTHGGGMEAFESPDRRTLFFTKGVFTPGLWSVPVEGGTESLVIESARVGHWAVADKGIWYLDFAARSENGPAPLKFLRFDTRRVSQLGSIEKIWFVNNVSFSVSRDSRQVIWSQDDRNESDLMLIDNFR